MILKYKLITKMDYYMILSYLFISIPPTNHPRPTSAAHPIDDHEAQNAPLQLPSPESSATKNSSKMIWEVVL